MKTKIYTIMAAVAMAMGLASCGDDTWQPNVTQQGQVNLGTLRLDVSTAETLQSRADYDTSSFVVEIVSGDQVTESWTYSQMPEIMTLAVGEYSVRVYSHNVEKQAWDAPYFYGTKDFKILNNDITDLGTVVCKFSNIKVDVVFADDLREVMGSDSKVTVIANDEGLLTFTPSETRSGYFEALPASNTLVATLEGTVASNPVTIIRTYTNVAPGTHYVITYSLKSGNTEIDETGKINPASGISIDTDVTDVNTGGNVSVTEDTIPPGERPDDGPVGGDPDPGTDPTPGTDPADNPISFTSTTLDLTGAPNSPEVDEAVVVLTSEHGFAHLNVTISSDNADFMASAGELMPMSFDLVTITGDDAANLASVGLPVGSDFNGKTQVDFNITDLVPLLAAFPGTHTFHLEIIDPEGNTNSLTLTFKA